MEMLCLVIVISCASIAYSQSCVGDCGAYYGVSSPTSVTSATSPTSTTTSTLPPGSSTPTECIPSEENCGCGNFGSQCGVCGWDAPTCPNMVPGSIVCQYGSCSFAAPCPTATGGDAPPALTSYPIYSYDKSDNYDAEIELSSTSCSGPEAERKSYCAPGSNSVQLVKFDGRVGFLMKSSESVTVPGYIDRFKGTALEPFQDWVRSRDKKSYRFCVETTSSYLVYKEHADSLLLGGSEAKMELAKMPVKYKFAIDTMQTTTSMPAITKAVCDATFNDPVLCRGLALHNGAAYKKGCCDQYSLCC
jgi:hypothetical protein